MFLINSIRNSWDASGGREGERMLKKGRGENGMRR